jgi:hypothetical protein
VMHRNKGNVAGIRDATRHGLCVVRIASVLVALWFAAGPHSLHYLTHSLCGPGEHAEHEYCGPDAPAAVETPAPVRTCGPRSECPVCSFLKHVALFPPAGRSTFVAVVRDSGPAPARRYAIHRHAPLSWHSRAPPVSASSTA